eukprot:2233084-Rhodomonas_salina.3
MKFPVQSVRRPHLISQSRGESRGGGMRVPSSPSHVCSMGIRSPEATVTPSPWAVRQITLPLCALMT